jgi:hypothetical protein
MTQFVSRLFTFDPSFITDPHPYAFTFFLQQGGGKAEDGHSLLHGVPGALVFPGRHPSSRQAILNFSRPVQGSENRASLALPSARAAGQ